MVVDLVSVYEYSWPPYFCTSLNYAAMYRNPFTGKIKGPSFPPEMYWSFKHCKSAPGQDHRLTDLCECLLYFFFTRFY